MQLAVFGASGRTGQALIDLALSRGWGLRALVRPASRFQARSGVEIVRGTLDSAPAHSCRLLYAVSSQNCARRFAVTRRR